MANVGQMNGLIIEITFPVYGLENKFQCTGTNIFMPETDKFLAILRFELVFFAVYTAEEIKLRIFCAFLHFWQGLPILKNPEALGAFETRIVFYVQY